MFYTSWQNMCTSGFSNKEMFRIDYGSVVSILFCHPVEFFLYFVLRYADIIVHRLLAVAIGADTTYPDLMDKHKQSALCNNLNYRHKMSQYAQRASVAFHTQVNTHQHVNCVNWLSLSYIKTLFFSAVVLQEPRNP